MTRKSLKLSFKPAACAIILTMALAGQSPAEGISTEVGFVEDAGGDARINYAGKLRMLSQRIPAAACNYHAGIATDTSEAALTTALHEFHDILAALEFGGDSLGIHGAEDRPRTVRIIAELHSIFDPIEAALESDAGGPPSDATLQLLVAGNTDVLDMAKLLVSEITGQYANPVALLQSDAMAIDIAGRQRMLTQKMSKEVCLIMSGLGPDSAHQTLASTVQTFEVSLGALQNGMTDVGINPPPNAAIIEGLQLVSEDWAAVAPLVAKVSDGGTINDEERALVFEGLSLTLKDMNTVVGMYSEASKLGL